VLVVGEEIIVPDGEIATPVVSVSSGSSKSYGGPSYEGYYMRPVKGVRSQGLHGNNAVDIAAPEGTPIYAAASGEIIISQEGGWNGGYGNYIVIKHSNGTQTLYAHNKSNAVSVGQKVSQGDVIGYVGHTGRTTGPTGNHVHFEVRGAANPF
jgi:murein DD-endopeptidase MepM/ murein hydrolase activator NlpD